jgi:hypothetical protein
MYIRIYIYDLCTFDFKQLLQLLVIIHWDCIWEHDFTGDFLDDQKRIPRIQAWDLPVGVSGGSFNVDRGLQGCKQQGQQESTKLNLVGAINTQIATISSRTKYMCFSGSTFDPRMYI